MTGTLAFGQVERDRQGGEELRGAKPSHIDENAARETKLRSFPSGGGGLLLHHHGRGALFRVVEDEDHRNQQGGTNELR